MNFNDHSKLEGMHACFGASKYTWINKNSEEMLNSYINSYVTSIGTALHDIARKHIKQKIKLSRSSKNEILLQLVEDYGIPRHVIDINSFYDNLVHYVNDAIGFRLKPEVILFYSDLFFGTADAIEFKNNFLRIHDLKTGVTKSHMEQLLIYAALFCLEYDVKPKDIQSELRIYQSNEVIICKPTVEDIVPIMDKIVTFNKSIANLRNEDY